MDISSAIYAYEFANAAMTDVNAAAYAAIVGFFALTVVGIIVGPYVYGFFVYRKKEAEKLEKRKTIQNLVIMKDIQGELEEEMRRALTNANLSQ